MKKFFKTRSLFHRIIMGGSALILSIAIIVCGLPQASPVQAGAGLPPREKPVPPPQDKKRASDKPVGATIELQAQAGPAGNWSVVQWQDSAGNWRDVEGWQGALGATGFERWWVAAKDFNSGPFRWRVTQGPGGPEVGASQPFNLPGGANQTVQVRVLAGQ